MNAQSLYREMRHYERRARRYTKLAAQNEYSRHRGDQLAADLQGEEADQCDALARDIRTELGL